MPTNVRPDEVNTATLAIHVEDLALVGCNMPPESFKHLLDLLVKHPAERHTIEGAIYVQRNGPLSNSQAIDLLQAVIGPAKIQRPVKCCLRFPNGVIWQPIGLKKPVRARTVKEFHV